MDEITAVGKVLKRLRKQKGLSQFDLGMLTGFQQNQISQYENRGVNKLDTIKVFAEFYETTVSKIIEMAEEYTPADEEDARIEQ